MRSAEIFMHNRTAGIVKDIEKGRRLIAAGDQDPRSTFWIPDLRFAASGMTPFFRCGVLTSLISVNKFNPRKERIWERLIKRWQFGQDQGG